MHITILSFILLVFFFFLPPQTHAFYQPEYQNRAITNVLDGLCPKPGFLFQVFFYNFKSVRLKDDQSHTLPGDFKLSVNTNLYNFVYISHNKLLGGYAGVELMIPFISGHLTSGTMRDDDHGLSDIFLGGFIQWNRPNYKLPLYQRFLVGMIFPTGDYEHEKLFNVGYNLYTLHCNYVLTAFLTPRLSTSFRFMYNFHTENYDYGPEKDDLRPGQLFSVNFASSYQIREGIRVAVIGNYWQQTTADELNGHDLDIGKERVLGLGPGLILQRKNKSFIVHGLFDSHAKNRPQGTTIQGRFMWFF